MDPNENLHRLRVLSAQILNLVDTQETLDDIPVNDVVAGLAEELAYHFQELDNWIIKDGFLPKSWNKKKAP